MESAPLIFDEIALNFCWNSLPIQDRLTYRPNTTSHIFDMLVLKMCTQRQHICVILRNILMDHDDIHYS